jgi:hypothetical protein
MKDQDEMKLTNKNPDATGFEREEQELAGVFTAYRESVQAWSTDIMSRERRVVVVSARRPLSLRLATFAMTAVLLASVVTGGVVQHERNVQQAQKIAQQKASEQKLADFKVAQEKQATQAQVAANQGMQDDELLADVDRDVAQDSPSAMEPLASLMAK